MGKEKGSNTKKVFLVFLLLTFLFQFDLYPLNSKPQQIKKDQEELKYEVVVVLKLVQVYVTDKKGNPVTDLAKDDFILYDNGKLQEITDFERHILTKPEKKVEKKIGEKIVEAEPSPAPKIPTGMNRKFFLLLDITRCGLAGYVRSKKAVLHFLDTQILPGDEVALYSYSSSSDLTTHEYLTTDQEKVKKAIKRIRQIPGKINEEGDLTTAEMERMKLEVNRFINEIEKFAKSLRYIPGYKNIILFSAGIERDLLYDVDDSSIRLNLQQTVKELAAISSPIYTVNTAGIRAYFNRQGSRGDHSLKMISDWSGGKYFYDVVHYKSIAEQIQNITSNYYVLGYYIEEKWDGKYHEIKAKVKRKGYIVRAQGGYFDPKPFKKFNKFEKGLHLMNLALAEKPKFQDPLNFPSVALPCSGKKGSNLVLLSEIGLDKIEEVRGEETEVVALILDEENNIVDSSRRKIVLSKMPQKAIYPFGIFSLLSGEYKCRLILRNLETGKGAVASSTVFIPEIPDSGLRLYPPSLLVTGKEAFYLKASKLQKGESEKNPLSLINIYPSFSGGYSPLVEVLDKGISKILAAVQYTIFNIPAPEVELSAHLIKESSGEKIPLSFSILSAQEEEKTHTLLIEFELPELQPGKYSLDITAEEETTKSKSQTTRTFLIK
jgi:VWFA-related protein